MISTPTQIFKKLKQRIDALKEQGIKPTVDNLNKQFMTEFITKIKEQNNE